MTKTKKTILNLGLLIFVIIIIVSYASFQKFEGEESTKNEIVEQSKKNEHEKKEKEKQENDDKIKKYEEKYSSILKNKKSYKDMTPNERSIAVELINNWNILNDEFKVKYSDSKSVIESSFIDYKNEKEAIGYETGITYEQLARTPDEYEGEKVKLSGKVVQVMEETNEIYLRLAVDSEYNSIAYIEYSSEITDKRILEGDYVTIKGQSMGLYTYKSTAGKLVTIPHIYISEIEINE